MQSVKRFNVAPKVVDAISHKISKQMFDQVSRQLVDKIWDRISEPVDLQVANFFDMASVKFMSKFN